MVGEASGRMQKADCRDEIALPAAMLAWLKYRKQRTRNSRKRFLVFFCSLFVTGKPPVPTRFAFPSSSVTTLQVLSREVLPSLCLKYLISYTAPSSVAPP